MNTKLSIEGMHCDGCAERVKHVLEREKGVRSADVSHAAGEARVEYDEHVVNPNDLEAVVQRVGFTARTAS